MRSATPLLPTLVLFLLAGACSQSTQEASKETAPGAASSDFMPEITIREIMESMVDPSADALWDSVAYISTLEGTIDRKPETDEDWRKLRGSAVTLAEATNALVVPQRRVDAPGTQSDDPQHELGPDEIQAMIDKNRPTWVGFAHAMHAVAMDTIRVIDTKDVDGLLEVGDAIDQACENCHMTFWYPPRP